MNEDSQIETALKSSLHSDEPSPELMRRLRVAAQAKTSVRSPWRSGLALIGTGAAALAIGAMILMPTKAVAKTYEGIVKAAGKVNAFEFSIETTDEHGKHEEVSIAGSDGSALIKTPDGTLLKVGDGKVEVYDSKANTVTQFTYGDFIDEKAIMSAMKEGLAEGIKQIDLKQMLKDYELKYGKDRIQIDPITQEGGRDVYHVTLSDREQNDRVEMTVDAASDLPIRLDIEEKTPTRGWRKETVMRMRFGDEVNPSLLEGRIPKSAKVIDMNFGTMMSKAIREGAEKLK